MDEQVFEKRKERKEERKGRESGREGRRKGDWETIMMMQDWLCKKKRKRKKEGVGEGKGRGRRRRRKTNEYQKIKQSLWHIVELLSVFGTLNGYFKIRLKNSNMKWRRLTMQS